MEKYQINTGKRKAAFLAQLAVENAQLTQLTESFNYSVEALYNTFGQHLTHGEAASYGRTPTRPANQEMIANLVYANRYGNGDFDSGDGWRYRGRILGLTFRANYCAAAVALGQPLEVNPDLCLTPVIGCDVAGWFWSSRNLNAMADADAFEQITRVITGPGLTGLAQRQRYYADAKSIV